MLEETFMKGLILWIKAEVECWEPIGLVQMMKLAQRVENHELRRIDVGVGTKTASKAQAPDIPKSNPYAITKDVGR